MTKELAIEAEMYQIGALRESTTILKQTHQESPPL